MAQDPTQVLIPTRAKLWLADVGTTFPADEAATPTGFTDVGLTTEDGTQLTTNPTMVDIYSHQSDVPVKTFKSREAVAVDVVLQQFNAANITAVLGGGVSAEPTSGHYKWSPPSAVTNVPTAAILDWTGDEGYLYRLCIPVARATNAVTIPLNKTSEARLPLHLAIQGGDTGDAWYILTNDPAFEPAA